MNDSVSHQTNNGQPSIAQTRRELIDFLSRDNRGETKRRSNYAKSADSERDRASRSADTEPESGFSWTSMVEAGLASWWRDHPARTGAVLLGTAIEETARRRPLPTIAVAAAVGAAVVFIKPWRLVSTTAVMLTIFRSSNFTSVATSLLEKAAQSLQKERT